MTRNQARSTSNNDTSDSSQTNATSSNHPANTTSSNRHPTNTTSSRRTQGSPKSARPYSINPNPVIPANQASLNSINPYSAAPSPAPPANQNPVQMPGYQFLNGPPIIFLGNMTPDWSAGYNLPIRDAPLEEGRTEPQQVRTWRELRTQAHNRLNLISPRMISARDEHMNALRHGVDATEARGRRATLEGQYLVTINDYFYWDNGVRVWEDHLNTVARA